MSPVFQVARQLFIALAVTLSTTAPLIASNWPAWRGADGTGRSPIERALVALISPALFPSERAFLTRNTFRLRYRDFDWRLNDLTGGRPY